MKTFFLIVTFLFFFSCKNTTPPNSKLHIESDVDNTTISTNDLEEKSVQTNNEDEITKEPIITEEKLKPETPVVEEKTPVVKTKTAPEKREEVVKEAVVNKEETVTKEVVKEATPEIEKVVVITKANHEAWDKLSKTYVSSSGKVNYKGFKSELASIESYLQHLENTPPAKDWTKNEKLAYWFNLYNASTVHLVASNYPIKSIKDINAGKPWDKKFIKSGANLYSLNDIENTIVRPNYNEPRLHVAFNCAAVSCPNLLNGAFTPAKLNTQLNSLSKKWLNDTSKNKITADNIEISQIFNWYKVDFKEGIVPFINKNSTTQVSPTAAITFMEYNWDLNE